MTILITLPDDMYVVSVDRRPTVSQLVLSKRKIALTHQEVLSKVLDPAQIRRKKMKIDTVFFHNFSIKKQYEVLPHETC